MSTQALIKSSSGIQQVSMESQHMSRRRLFLTGEITPESAMDFMKQVMFLNDEDERAPISVFINSEGGEIVNGLTIHDIIIDSKAPIHTFCTGCAYSMGAVLFASGRKRYMLPHSKLMLHEPLLGSKIGGSASSIKSISDSLLASKAMINQLLSNLTGKTEEEMDKLTSYDHYFTAREAVEIGLCDGIKTFHEMMEGCV